MLEGFACSTTAVHLSAPRALSWHRGFAIHVVCQAQLDVKDQLSASSDQWRVPNHRQSVVSNRHFVARSPTRAEACSGPTPLVRLAQAMQGLRLVIARNSRPSTVAFQSEPPSCEGHSVSSELTDNSGQMITKITAFGRYLQWDIGEATTVHYSTT